MFVFLIGVDHLCAIARLLSKALQVGQKTDTGIADGEMDMLGDDEAVAGGLHLRIGDDIATVVCLANGAHTPLSPHACPTDALCFSID